MGRKPLEEVEINKDSQTLETVVQIEIEEEKNHELSVIQAEEQYGDGQPYERIRLENEVRFYQDQVSSSLIEIGKRLIRLKTQEGHGGFLVVLENIGMTERPAQYAMLAAKKFSNTNTCSYLGGAKLRALSVLEEDDIQTLEEGGEVAGVTLDEIERMTVRELKAALRKEKDLRKKEKTAQEQTIAQKEEKLNDLERELRYRELPTKEELAKATLDNMAGSFFIPLVVAIENLHKALKAIDEIQKIEGITLQPLEALIEQYSYEFTALTNIKDELLDAVDSICPKG